MNRLQKTIFIAIFIGSAVVLSRHSQAQPNAFSAVTAEDIARLESMHQQASDLLLKNDFDAAIRVYSDILLMEPDDETAYTGLGQIYMVLGQFKRAHEAFQNALHINPDNQVALVGIRQIMDPDGMEGMVSRQEAELEPSPLSLTETSRPPAEPVRVIWLSFKDPDKRLSASRAKKNDPSFTRPAPIRVAPVQVMAPRETRILPKRSAAKRTSSGSFGRLGLLHAQRMQMALKNAGFYHGPVDGMIGASTKDAIRAFQKESRLPVTGRMSSDTWSKLTDHLSAR